MKQECVTFRQAAEADVPRILRFIRDLAEYEQLGGEVVATEELLTEWLFRRHTAEVLFAVADGQEVGFALYFHNFSTFLGRGGLYLEDLYVLPAYRERGIGTAIFHRLAELAESRGCGRLEWWCLDRNQPAVGFYRSLGAEAMSDWTVYRLAGDSLHRLAGEA